MTSEHPDILHVDVKQFPKLHVLSLGMAVYTVFFGGGAIISGIFLMHRGFADTMFALWLFATSCIMTMLNYNLVAKSYAERS